MKEEQIKYMVDRFLSWKLPQNFNPDGGITFTPMFNEHTAHPMRHEPSGTNLFDYEQARQMVLHMIDGLPEEDMMGVAFCFDGATVAPEVDDERWGTGIIFIW